MPPDHHRHHHHHHSHGVHQELPKPNQKFLSLILKALIMTFITSLFFLFLGVAAFLLLLFLAGGALHRRHHHNQPFRLRRSSSSAAAFSPRDLRRLPQFRFPSGSETIDCVICLDALRDGQWCRRLGACGHVFHRRCLDAWLVKVPACPVCRTRVRLDFGDRASSSSGDFEEEAKRWWGLDPNNGFQGLVG